MSPTRPQGLWQWAHIFLLLSILCSGFYAAILPVLLLLLPEPIHVYCHETVFYLLLLAFQPIFLLDTIQHTSFCIHNCTSLKFPQFRLSRIGGTYQTSLSFAFSRTAPANSDLRMLQSTSRSAPAWFSQRRDFPAAHPSRNTAPRSSRCSPQTHRKSVGRGRRF